MEALTAYATALKAAAERAASPYERALAHVAAGLVAVADFRAADTQPLFVTAIETLAAIPTVEPVADAVEGLAGCAAARGNQDRATRLAELAAGLRDGSRPVESVANAVAPDSTTS